MVQPLSTSERASVRSAEDILIAVTYAHRSDTRWSGWSNDTKLQKDLAKALQAIRRVLNDDLS